ncbi:MAG: family 43 glycosylhydrolase [Paludibacter sp.]|nr:family 43 glycosylhydrolase [Paludibacter sp.]
MNKHNKSVRFFLPLLLLFHVFTAFAQPTQRRLSNPVFEMEDGCIERFMGNYYAPLNSKLLVTSQNLVTWQNTNVKYGDDNAGDLIFRNGVFHSYWNGIGHAYAPGPLGPYTVTSSTVPFDDYGIDVQVFQDEDGELYYIKKRNPGDPHPLTQAAPTGQGATVWTMRMKTPFTRWDITEGSVQLTHQPGHPTSLNMLNFEGPEFFKHRGRYYMTYVSNRMGQRSGMYQIGVAESDQPMNFDNSKKYPHPIMIRNTEQQMQDYDLIAPTAEHGGWSARYITTSTAPTNWQTPAFDDTSWSIAEGGFGKQTYDLFAGVTFTNVLTRARKTTWSTSKIFIRRKFTLSSIPAKAALKHWVYGNANFYINGNKVVLNSRNHTYSYLQINPAMLTLGENVIAVEVTSPCSDDNCQQFVDFGVYDTRGNNPEDIVIGPGQPNFIAGPNGFEKWMVYKAYFNAGEKQGIERIHFYNKEVVVESSTVKNSKGYRPIPAQPTYMNYCDNASYHAFQFLNQDSLKFFDGILAPKTSAGSEMLFRKQADTNYRMEVPFRITDINSWAGVYAYYQDTNNWMKIQIGRNKTWKVEKCVNGIIETTTANLPAKFEFLDTNPLVAAFDEPWHILTIYKNGNRFKVELDFFNLTLQGDIVTPFAGAGLIGLVASSDKVSFDAFQYTTGWEEYDNLINGWENQTGSWLINSNGLYQTASSGIAQTFKGDKAWNYDFSLYMKNNALPFSGSAGFYPLYIDADNYVKAMVNYATKTIEIEGKEAGNPITPQSLSLKKKVERHYTVSTYPTTSYRYDLRNESMISGVDILWLEGYYPYLNQTFDLPNSVQFYALQNGTWQLITAQLEGQLRFSYYNRFTFPAIKASAIRMDVTNKSGKASRAFNAYFHEDIASGYFLRCRREDDGLHIFVDDTYQTVVNGNWGKSKVGLITENLQANFNGILHYQSGAVNITSIDINASSCGVGESEQLTFTIAPYNATNTQLYWKSSNPEIVSVSQNGVITRNTGGAATITAYAADGTDVKATVFIGETATDLTKAEELVRIFPNPVSNTLNYLHTERIELISIYSVYGKKMMEIKPDGSGKIVMKDFPSGVYLFRAQTDGKSVSKSFIINNYAI